MSDLEDAFHHVKRARALVREAIHELVEAQIDSAGTDLQAPIVAQQEILESIRLAAIQEMLYDLAARRR